MKRIALTVIGLSWISTAAAATVPVRVKITNLAPANGTFLTPFWVGFHDGSFDLYNLGEPASEPLERIAEDGNADPLVASFSGEQGVLPGSMGPIAPGEMTSMIFHLDPMSARYFSYASMVIPSNDAFIANGNATAFEVFDAAGNFNAITFTVLGSMVRDAGTEVNDELPMNTAFFGQMAPDTGVDENGVIQTHGGFKPMGSGGILDDPMFANADFTQAGYEVAQITIEAIPEPGTLALAGGALLVLLIRRKR